ncbi:MAG: FHA domain-containing protein [Chitinispirillales bacterium]|jgi:ABC-type multidrug transport system ATPase subunit/pSer/pThr/pTyr-binding forkhead associated (FHA) protein|nr:FHA domain-containing protein [Chitinispirillales bacterium]
MNQSASTPASAAPQAAYSFPLDGREIRIGRDGTVCDVCLAGFGVSRQHAVIRCGERPVIIDLDSSCGTRLDGELIKETVLPSGAAVTIGIHVLQVFIDDGYISLTHVNSDEYATEFSGEGADAIKIGRDSANDICLHHPMVSRFHAVVKTADGKLSITDLGSANSTYLNGCAVGTAALGEGDVVHIGPFRFYVTGGKFCRIEAINKIRIDAHGLGVRIKGKKILDNVNLTIEPGAFVAFLGASGAGKSMLSKVLSGQLAPTSGRLFLNGFPATKFSAAFARGIGYVSQQILLRPELTVWETLTDQSLIRLPGDSTARERLIRAEEVLDIMELTRQRDRRVANLSGGEARRLHVGVELLASPAVVILDEPLAGLDPGLIGKFMQLFRRICDKGHTLILITHNLEKLELCDRAVYIQGGKVLFSGAPGEICAHFGVEEIARVYDQTNLSEFGAEVEAGKHAAEPITVLKLQQPQPRGEWAAAFRRPLQTATLFARQTCVLTARYGRVYLRDRRNMLLLMAQTPLITLLLGFVYKFNILQFPISFYFCLTVTGIWVGGLDAVREVAAELPLLARESKCGLNRVSYITARIATAAALSASQAVLFIISAVAIFHNLEFSIELLILLFAAIVAGNVLGLVVSVCSGSVGRAISTLPIVLIPQIFFSGILVQFEYMAELGRQISHLTVSRPVFSVMKQVFFLDRPLFWHSDWTELFLLCAGLIIIFWVALSWRTSRGGAA